MPRKWLDRVPWSNKPDAPGARADGNRERDRNSNSYANAEKEYPMPPALPPTQKDADDEPTNFEVELLPTEEIYRAAGVTVPRRGYSIIKVVEMLSSQHIRSLTPEMKRVAVLMALDAAGIPLDEIQQDAKARQQALDSYEVEQRKRAESEWARKEEENVQIEAELERIKAHHMARIHRNLEGVAREKASFEAWVALKQKESQSMTEAAELCFKPPAALASSPTPLTDILQAKAKTV